MQYRMSAHLNPILSAKFHIELSSRHTQSGIPLFKLFLSLPAFTECRLMLLNVSTPTHMTNEKANKSLSKVTFVRSYPYTNSYIYFF